MIRPLVTSAGSTSIAVATVLALAAALSPTSAQAPSGSESNVAVRIIVRMSEQPHQDPTSREYRMTLVPGVSSRIVHGSRLPIPATSFNAAPPGEGRIVPMTSYTYQTIGFQANLAAKIGTEDGRILIEGKVEDSRMRRLPGESGHPEIDAVEQSVHVYVKPGETVVVHRSDSGRRKVEIRLQADRTG